MSVNVKLNGDVLTLLNVKHLYAILAKYTKHTLAHILTRNLNDILLTHPRLASTVRNTTAGG